MMMRLQLEKSDAESKHAIRGFRRIGVVLPTGKQVCFHETGRFAYVPTTGFGTAVYPFVSFKTMKESILYAIKLGYQHFDSAAVYQSEQSLGEAIADAIRLGFIKSHEELFITSKLWCFDAHHDHALPAIQKSLNELEARIAKARGKSVAQACLRWVYEQGGSVLVKCFSKERLKENLHIFDWELSAQDSEMINQLPQKDFLELSSYQMSALINLPRIYGMVKLLEHGKM